MKLLIRNYFTVSLIGRPNVGKSSLFNLLAGQKTSLVDSLPGLTRDRIEKVVSLFGAGIKLVDTAGWDPDDTGNPLSIIEQMKYQTRLALSTSDLALFLIDAREGVTSEDLRIAELIRRERLSLNKEKVILVANKAESTILYDLNNEVWKLGLGEPIYISAANNERIVDLYSRIRESIPDSYIDEYSNLMEKRKERHHALKSQLLNELVELESLAGENFNIKEWSKEYDKLNHEEASDYDSDSNVDLFQNIINPANKSRLNKQIRVAVIGKPNVGKSTMINSIVKEERVIVDDRPGTTRDSIYIDYVYKGRKYQLIDTAGLYKRQRSKVDKMVFEDVQKAIQYSRVVLLMFDCKLGLSANELDMVRKSINEGRALLVIGNKWDLIESSKKNKYASELRRTLEKKVSLKGLHIVFTSAPKGYNLDACFDQINELYVNWNERISTSLLNRWLDAFTRVYSLPSHAGVLLKIKFIAQIKVRPPTFYMFVNDKSLITEKFYKHFTLSLRKEFKFRGIPIRIIIRDKAKRAVKVHKPGFRVNKIKLISTTEGLLKQPPATK